MRSRAAVFSRLGLSALFAVCLIVAGCGGDDDAEVQAPAGQAGEALPVTYVRDISREEISSNDPLIALVVSNPDGDDQAIKAYVCDGEGLWALFPETAAGDDFELSSDDGSDVIEGTISGTEVTGKLALDGGDAVTFSAIASKAVGNLYDVEVGEDLSFNGSAPDGDSFTGKLTEIRDDVPPGFEDSPFPVYRADLQFDSEDSSPGAKIAPIYSGEVPNELFVIGSDEGAALGGPKTKAGNGTFFTWRMID